VVNEYSQTSVPSIWAVGDVTDRINLTPVALMEGMALAKTLALNQPTKPDYDFVPSAVFSNPSIATVVRLRSQGAGIWQMTCTGMVGHAQAVRGAFCAHRCACRNHSAGLRGHSLLFWTVKLSRYVCRRAWEVPSTVKAACALLPALCCGCSSFCACSARSAQC
jgi:hypothetical protein